MVVMYILEVSSSTAPPPTHTLFHSLSQGSYPALTPDERVCGKQERKEKSFK